MLDFTFCKEEDGTETGLWPKELGLPYSGGTQAEGQGYGAASEAVNTWECLRTVFSLSGSAGMFSKLSGVRLA